MTGNKLAQPARSNVNDSRKVQDNLISTFGNQAEDRFFQGNIAAANSYVAIHVQDGYLAHATLLDIKVAHIGSPCTRSSSCGPGLVWIIQKGRLKVSGLSSPRPYAWPGIYVNYTIYLV